MAGQPTQSDAKQLRGLIGAVVRIYKLGGARSPDSVYARHNLTDLQIIERLGEAGPQRIADLAEAFGMKMTTISSAAARLVEARLATRTPDPSDRRAVRLALSPSGRRVHSDLVAAQMKATFEILARLSPEDRVTFARILKGLVGD